MKIGDEIEVCQNGKVIAHGTLVALDMKMQDDAMAWIALIRQGDGLMNMVPIAAITNSDVSDGTGLTVKLEQPEQPEPRWHRYPDRVPTEVECENDACLVWHGENGWCWRDRTEVEDGDIWMSAAAPKEPTP